MPRLGLVFVASLGGTAQRGAQGFAMMSTAFRRAGTSSSGARAVISGARRGVIAFLGGATSLSTATSRSRWATTMSVAAHTAPSLSLHRKDSVQHPAYEVLEEDFVAEYGATTTLYKHKKSGAEVLSVQIDDDNKVRLFSPGQPQFSPLNHIDAARFRRTYTRGFCLTPRVRVGAASSFVASIVTLFFNIELYPLPGIILSPCYDALPFNHQSCGCSRINWLQFCQT